MFRQTVPWPATMPMLVRAERALTAPPTNVTIGVVRLENLYSPMAGA